MKYLSPLHILNIFSIKESYSFLLNTRPTKFYNRLQTNKVFQQMAKSSLANKSPPRTPKKRKAKKNIDPSPSPRKSPKKSVPKKVIYASDIEQISPHNKWIDLQVPPQELRPSATLTTGQSFSWMVVMDSITDQSTSSAWGRHDETMWIAPIGNQIITIKETPSTTMYRVVHGDEENITPFLVDYFQLETPLDPLYSKWSERDERLAKIANVIPGVRIIRQDPVECLFSFICSSNNNIPRITKMLSSFRSTYGTKILNLPVRHFEDGELSEPLNDQEMEIFSFPTLDQLQGATEQELRDMGLGYRADYIVKTRDLLMEFGGKEFLMDLRTKDAETVQEELIKFRGIGRKVADCVALFSLDQTEAIPVDVHVQRIASRDYDPTLSQAKSLTPTIYKRVGDLFRDRFDYAGWAHSLLFVAELPSFRDVLPVDIVEQMDAFKEDEIQRKAEEKAAKEARKALSPKKK